MYKLFTGVSCLTLLCLLACSGGKSNTDKPVDTVRIDTIQGNQEEDTIRFKLSPEELEEEEKRDEEESETPMTPQEG